MLLLVPVGTWVVHLLVVVSGAEGEAPRSVVWYKTSRPGAYLPTGIERELNGTGDSCELPGCLV